MATLICWWGQRCIYAFFSKFVCFVLQNIAILEGFLSVFKCRSPQSFGGLRPLDPHRGVAPVPHQWPLNGPLDPRPWWASARFAKGDFSQSSNHTPKLKIVGVYDNWNFYKENYVTAKNLLGEVTCHLIPTKDGMVTWVPVSHIVES